MMTRHLIEKSKMLYVANINPTRVKGSNYSGSSESNLEEV